MSDSFTELEKRFENIEKILQNNKVSSATTYNDASTNTSNIDYGKYML